MSKGVIDGPLGGPLPDVAPNDWARVEGTYDTQRLRVPGGWLYRVRTQRRGNQGHGSLTLDAVNVVFVPDR